MQQDCGPAWLVASAYCGGDTWGLLGNTRGRARVAPRQGWKQFFHPCLPSRARQLIFGTSGKFSFLIILAGTGAAAHGETGGKNLPTCLSDGRNGAQAIKRRKAIWEALHPAESGRNPPTLGGRARRRPTAACGVRRRHVGALWACLCKTRGGSFGGFGGRCRALLLKTRGLDAGCNASG